jgi:hypothetical protein
MVIVAALYPLVMAGLDPAIHVFLRADKSEDLTIANEEHTGVRSMKAFGRDMHGKTWMAGTSPAMTEIV